MLIVFRRVSTLLLILIFSFPVLAKHKTNSERGIKALSKISIDIPVQLLPAQFRAFSADRCEVFFNRKFDPEVDKVTKTTKYFNTYNDKKIKLPDSLGTAQVVAEFLQILKTEGNLKSFRFYYKGKDENIERCTEINPNAKKLKEIKVIDSELGLLETSLFSQDEILYVKIIQKLPLRSFKIWWRENQVYEKVKQQFFYPTGATKVLVNYKEGLIHDTLTNFGQTGKIISQYLYDKGVKIKTLVDVGRATKEISAHKKAFLIGINEYAWLPDDFVQTTYNVHFKPVNDIAGAINDVQLIKNVLVDNQGFPETNVKILTDKQATRNGVLKALKIFVASLRPSDVVFMHFSALSSHVPLVDKSDEIFILTSDYSQSTADAINPYWITRKEINEIFDSAKKKIGKAGQLIVSYDACGQSADKQTTAEKAGEVSYRGEHNTPLFSSQKYANVPFVVLSGTSGDELSREINIDKLTFGAYSYALATTLKLPYALTDQDLIGEITTKVDAQTPCYYSNFPQLLFERNQTSINTKLVSLPDIVIKGNVHVISVGISKYPKNVKLSFANCVADAVSYNDYFTNQYTSLTDTGKVFSYLLTDSLATKDKIIAAINKTMSSKPEDYFVFNFSGYTIPLMDSLGKQVTYFVPYGLNNLTDTALIKKEGISLIQLKDLLQMIPANRQLFITEAGSTVNFQKEFIKNLIESSPTMASLSNKNRVFIIPKGAGMDNAVCNGAAVQHGPINYYLTNLSDEFSIYGLFENELYVNALKYALGKIETDCDYLKIGYFDVFFERNFIKDLQFFMPSQLGEMRGAKVINETKQKLISQNSSRYALVIGTDSYSAKLQWKNLANPVLDAKVIADQLENNYDYNVVRMFDKSLDSIYSKILDLSRKLKESDQLIIFVAGHGDFDSNLLDDGLIVTSDSKPSKDDPFRNSYLQYSKLSRMINKLPANQILLIMDVCFGGTFDDRVKREEGRTETKVYDDISALEYIEGKFGKKTRLFITSGGKKEVPDGYAGQHSPFAQRIIMLLQDKGGATNVLTATNLHQAVDKLPSGPLIGGFGDNKLGSEFLLIPKPKKK